jgi:hypothetical protein
VQLSCTPAAAEAQKSTLTHFDWLRRFLKDGSQHIIAGEFGALPGTFKAALQFIADGTRKAGNFAISCAHKQGDLRVFSF